MNSLFDLCEYGLKVRECQKLRLVNITPHNIILSDIKINNNPNYYSYTPVYNNYSFTDVIIFNSLVTNSINTSYNNAHSAQVAASSSSSGSGFGGGFSSGGGSFGGGGGGGGFR